MGEEEARGRREDGRKMAHQGKERGENGEGGNGTESRAFSVAFEAGS